MKTVFLALAALFVLSVSATAQDKNFYIFLAFGQSNMEGYPGVEDQDKGRVDPRFQMLAAVDFPDQGRQRGQWYTAVPPLARPGKILCIGVNYGKRNEEYGQVSAPSKYPNVFMRTPESLVGHGAPIVRPHVSEQLDYEGEITLVIGKPGRYISRDKAYAHIAGLTIANEGSVRDWMSHGKFNITQGKNFDRSGSIGPWIDTAPVTPDRDLRLRTWVNDELRQDDTTANMIWKFDFLIHYLSQFATLSPGDLILTGTPIGAGVRYDPPRWLKPGDRLKIEVSGVGCLENTIVDETTD